MQYERRVVLSDLVLGMVAGAAMMMLLPHALAATAKPRAAVRSPAAAIMTPGEGMLEDPCRAEASPAAAYDQRKDDWAWLCRYRADNARIAQEPRPDIVFMGDSITEFWAEHDPALFSHGIIDRGISGQTSPQMLVRFMQDVVALHPRAVHIMAGTNDVAGNTGPTSPDQFKNNIMAMVALARPIISVSSWRASRLARVFPIIPRSNRRRASPSSTSG